jgi:hypothetical protein
MKMSSLAGHHVLDSSLHVPLFQRGFFMELHDERVVR